MKKPDYNWKSNKGLMQQLSGKGYKILRAAHYYLRNKEGWGIAQYSGNGGWLKYDGILYATKQLCEEAIIKITSTDKIYLNENSLNESLCSNAQ